MRQRHLKGVATLAYEAERCIGCGRCVEVCPHAVFALDGRTARVVDRDGCMECGACARNCPSDAIAVDAGVGCAAAILVGMLTGKEPSCGPACEEADEEPGTRCC